LLQAERELAKSRGHRKGHYFLQIAKYISARDEGGLTWCCG
jgi:hypothetical protein